MYETTEFTYVTLVATFHCNLHNFTLLTRIFLFFLILKNLNNNVVVRKCKKKRRNNNKRM